MYYIAVVCLLLRLSQVVWLVWQWYLDAALFVNACIGVHIIRCDAISILLSV